MTNKLTLQQLESFLWETADILRGGELMSHLGHTSSIDAILTILYFNFWTHCCPTPTN